MCCEEHLWKFGLLQRVLLSNLVYCETYQPPFPKLPGDISPELQVQCIHSYAHDDDDDDDHDDHVDGVRLSVNCGHQWVVGLLFIPQVIYEHGESWWNDIDR